MSLSGRSYDSMTGANPSIRCGSPRTKPSPIARSGTVTPGRISAHAIARPAFATWCGPKHSDETIWWSHRSDDSVDEIS